ncbi:hypothetical protein MPH_07421 [Macrophomina phaseolina MS6]|uniref:Uncharacterized protein n=1 Tax=Macrophomina phaseolina (strain MS6) TaxID=1126212 RepID=K2SEV0_MACPH|nr:hypothetical protein MPH_07421 [Macrophomina phaseolina MS6]
MNTSHLQSPPAPKLRVFDEDDDEHIDTLNLHEGSHGEVEPGAYDPDVYAAPGEESGYGNYDKKEGEEEEDYEDYCCDDANGGNCEEVREENYFGEHPSRWTRHQSRIELAECVNTFAPDYRRPQTPTMQWNGYPYVYVRVVIGVDEDEDEAPDGDREEQRARREDTPSPPTHAAPSSTTPSTTTTTTTAAAAGPPSADPITSSPPSPAPPPSLSRPRVNCPEQSPSHPAAAPTSTASAPAPFVLPTLPHSAPALPPQPPLPQPPPPPPPPKQRRPAAILSRLYTVPLDEPEPGKGGAAAAGGWALADLAAALVRMGVARRSPRRRVDVYQLASLQLLDSDHDVRVALEEGRAGGVVPGFVVWIRERRGGAEGGRGAGEAGGWGESDWRERDEWRSLLGRVVCTEEEVAPECGWVEDGPDEDDGGRGGGGDDEGDWEDVTDEEECGSGARVRYRSPEF